MFFVKTVKGERIRIYTLLNNTIRMVKRRIEQKTGIPPHVQILTFGQTELRNGKLLSEIGIRNASTLLLEYSKSGNIAFALKINSALCL